MTKETLFTYWLQSAKIDYKAMLSLFNNGHYMWALFVGHLVLEKLLKAYYIKYVNGTAPYIHNLTHLAEKSNLQLSEEQKDFLDEVTTFNIKARYPDYKNRFYKKATRQFTEKYMRRIKEFKQWLSGKIRK
jgi:HEPN domain-containing protein